MIRQIDNYLKVFRENYFYSPLQRNLFRNLFTLPKISEESSPSVPTEIVLIPMLRDVSLSHRILFMVLGFKAFLGRPISLRWYFLEAYQPKPKTFFKIIFFYLKENNITRYLWARVYMSLGGRQIGHSIYRGSSETHSTLARKVFTSLKSKLDVTRISYSGINVGDLIYDSYLRYKPSPTIDLKDEYLLELIEFTFWHIDHFRSLIQELKPKYLFSVYATYIHHGTFVRVALDEGVKVYSCGARNQLICSPTKNFPFQLRNFYNYKIFFNRVERKSEILQKAAEALNLRLTGEIDLATSYMKLSAYEKWDKNAPRSLLSNGKKHLVIMAHDFFDSPHAYGEMPIPDFYEWLEILMTEAKTSRHNVYFKPHPNALPQNLPIYETFRSRYPHVIFLDSNTPNSKLASEGLDALCTAYGTIAHEMAYMGVKVICAGSNPHIAYNFCVTAKSINELTDWFHNFDQKDFIINKNEILEFFYTHNCRYNVEMVNSFPWIMNPEFAKNALNFNSIAAKEKIALMKAGFELSEYE